MERGHKTPDDLDRPNGNGLKTNYKKHDVGENVVLERFEDTPITVEAWGIDMRDDDGTDGIIYDDAMDFKLFYEDSEGEQHLVALLDVKTKGSPEYMGRFNKRHYDHYEEHAEVFDVPTYVAFFHVDYQENDVYDEFVTCINEADVYHSDQSNAVEKFPDRNKAVLVPHDERLRWWRFEDAIEREIADTTGESWYSEA